MSDTATSAAGADAITPANILAPASVPPPVTAPESKPPTAQPEAAAADADKKGPADEAASDDKPKSRFQRRIDDLTAAKHAAERIAEARARELHEARTQLDHLRRNRDPDDWQRQQADDTRIAIKEDRIEEGHRDLQRQLAEASDLRVKTWAAKIDAARERIPDLDKAVETFRNLPISGYAADIIAESDKAAEITSHLAAHPDEAERIASLPPHRQGLELAKIEAKFHLAPQPRRTSNAPPPVPIIGATNSQAEKAVKDMGVEEIGRLIYGR